MNCTCKRILRRDLQLGDIYHHPNDDGRCDEGYVVITLKGTRPGLRRHVQYHLQLWDWHNDARLGWDEVDGADVCLKVRHV